jgi:biopolymer transport protein ExbB/TolQ
VNNLYEGTTQLFYHLSNAFFWPVAMALLSLFAITLVDLGGLLAKAWKKSRQPVTDLPGVARALAQHRWNSDDSASDALFRGVRLSPSLKHFWGRLEGRLRETGSSDNLDLWLEETLQQEEMAVTSRLDRTRAFVRLGPMLGLAGTIIPLGPAVQSLLGGDLTGMVNHLVIGFGAVVCGLMMSGLSYAITLVRERWARVELKEMENLCELVLRARRGQGTPEVERYESLSKA